MKIRLLRTFTAAVQLLLLGLAGCATEPGDTVDCPTCDNATELLVGARCVAIAEVAVCGPDGHSHGDECHCFSGQQPTEIGGKEYCLQQGCAGSGEQTGDPDEQACEEVALEPEQATAVTRFAEFESVHLEDGKVVEVTLPAGQESFVHCAALAAGHLRVDLSVAGVLDAALDAEGNPLELEGGAANPDCSEVLPAVHEVHLETGATYPHPVVLRFKAGSVASVKLIVRSPTAK